MKIEKRIIACFDNGNGTTTTVYLINNKLIEITTENNIVIEIKGV